MLTQRLPVRSVSGNQSDSVCINQSDSVYWVDCFRQLEFLFIVIVNIVIYYMAD